MSARSTVSALLASLLLTMPLAAQTPEPQPPSEEAPPKRMQLPAPVVQMRAIYQSRLATLQAEFARTHEPLRAAELQAEIRLAKLQFEADFLGYQLERARRYGRSEAAAELRRSLAAIQALMGGAPPDSTAPVGEEQ